mgnify:CR=1 FL=1
MTQQRLTQPGGWQLAAIPADVRRNELQSARQDQRDQRQNLAPVWTFSTGVNEGHQAPPIVNNGVMFITTPQAQR